MKGTSTSWASTRAPLASARPCIFTRYRPVA